MVSNDFKAQVIKALENPQYDWRTIQGLASELHASESEVVRALGSLRDIVVRTEDGQGRRLFTTRSHYEKTHGFADKLLSALSDRIVA
jgi:predicted transcriptional regulator